MGAWASEVVAVASEVKPALRRELPPAVLKTEAIDMALELSKQL